MASKQRPRTRVKLVDVARQAGVSVATVSNALNNRDSVEESTKRRVQAVAEQMGYSPNLHARRLRVDGIGTIGLFASMPIAIAGNESRLGYMLEVASAAAIKALESGFALSLLPPTEAGLPVFDRLALDGALVCEPSADDIYVEKLTKLGLPIVTIGQQPDSNDATACIDMRSSEAAAIVLNHLVASSSLHIALILGTTKRNSYSETIAVYSKLAKSRKMKPIIVRVDESGGERAAYEATLRLMEEHPQIDGIYAAVDVFAVGALRALKKLGRSVPGDVCLATRYDGRRARNADPEITAVDLRLDEIGALAMNLLLEQIRAGANSRVLQGPLPTLIPRQSTRRPSRNGSR